MIVRLNNEADKYFKNYLRIRLFRLPDKPGSTATAGYEEGIYLDRSIEILSTKEYHRFYHKAGERYLVAFSDRRSS